MYNSQLNKYLKKLRLIFFVDSFFLKFKQAFIIAFRLLKNH